GGAACQGHADRQHDPAAPGGGPRLPAGREEQGAAAADPRALGEGTGGGPGPGAVRGTRTALAAVHRGRSAEGGRAPRRAGPARRVAGGPVPRHPDHPVRPADGRTGTTGADAPRAAPRRHAPWCQRRGSATAPRVRPLPLRPAEGSGTRVTRYTRPYLSRPSQAAAWASSVSEVPGRTCAGAPSWRG